MTLTQINSEFDLLFENLATGGNIGLDDSEKAICLTVAQQMLVKQIVSTGQLDQVKQLISLNSIALTTAEDAPEPPGEWVPSQTEGSYKTPNTFKVSYATTALVRLGYSVNNANKSIPARVVTEEVIDKLLMSPYQYPPKNVVYVVVGDDALEVFPPLSFTPTHIMIREVAMPADITATDLGGNSEYTVIGKEWHQDLINQAVQYAIQTYVGIPEKEVGNDS